MHPVLISKNSYTFRMMKLRTFLLLNISLISHYWTFFSRFRTFNSGVFHNPIIKISDAWKNIWHPTCTWANKACNPNYLFIPHKRAAGVKNARSHPLFCKCTNVIFINIITDQRFLAVAESNDFRVYNIKLGWYTSRTFFSFTPTSESFNETEKKSSNEYKLFEMIINHIFVLTRLNSFWDLISW